MGGANIFTKPAQKYFRCKTSNKTCLDNKKIPCIHVGTKFSNKVCLSCIWMILRRKENFTILEYGGCHFLKTLEYGGGHFEGEYFDISLSSISTAGLSLGRENREISSFENSFPVLKEPQREITGNFPF